MITNVIYAVLVLGVIAVVFGLILSVAAKAFEVKVDERLPKIQACLAGANCGGCGYPGCAGCAEAILAGKAPVTACAPAGAEGAAKIAEIMGMEAPSGEKQVAHVLCNGGEASVKNFEYVGLHDCVAATKVAGGPTACSFGCMGFGTCVAACQFDAIHINEQGVAEVDKEKCTNCGACREACPRKLIVEVPYKQKVFVNCSNKEKGPAVTKVCANSCIACGMCERTCKFDAIHVVNNVAVIDYDKCRNCTMCAKACPRNAIEPIPTPEEKEKFKAAQKAAAERKAAAETEYDQTVAKLWDEYQLSVSQAEQLCVEFDSLTALRAQVADLRGKIRALGSVNVSAIEEYKEVKARYDELSRQVTDVEESRNELSRMIAKLSAQMREIFTDSFRAINENFSRVFTELFGGGEASLVLEDESDVLACGIGIRVAPPGKVIKNLEALSGGEQALVAISIYFAILAVNPAPFCILDEIEAALDDANVVRFAQYLRRISDKTQFIVITHRRGTMEAANVLYGVTMQEDGVSKLLKLDLEQVDATLVS